MLLSASTAFAATDDVAISEVNDEISIDEEVLAVDDADVLESSDDALIAEETLSAEESGNVVTNDTFYNYFDESGTLLETVTSNELTFEGDFSDVGVSYISIDKPITLTGNNAIFSGVNFVVMSNDVIIDGFTINMNQTDMSAITVSDVSNVVISNNNINFKALDGIDSYAVYADGVDNFKLLNNIITYVGTNGTVINNAVRVTGDLKKSSDVKIEGNTFNISIPSAAIPWFEVPPSSGNWVSAPISEGIVVADSSDVTFDGNVVNVDFSDVVGGYDTIYSVDFKDSDNAVISNNDITSNGNTYIYGIIITGDNFTIKDNNITSTGDYYANGIDVEGPATGVVEDNKIDVKAGTSAYAIYSGMNGADVKANYTGNEIKGDAYNVFGFSSGDVEANIADNNIDLTGNYTTGIAYRGSTLLVENNTISAKGSNVGNESIWEQFGVETIGVKVTKGVATIANNTINSTGDYAIKMVSNSISDNVLVSNGKNPINIEAGSNDVVSEGPELKTIIVVNDFSKQYGATSQFKITVLDENGNVVANKNVKVNVGGKTLSAKTDANGIAKFNIDLAVGSYNAKVIFEGDKVNGPKETASKIVVKKATTKLTAKAKTFKAKTKTKKYTITLKANGKALKKVKVTIKVGKKTYKATTNSKGKATFKITKLTKKGKYTAKVKFAGNKSYKAVTKKVKITVKK